MHISHIKLRNWRNFREVDVDLFDRTYLIGPNASGKSNFLDVFKFLRDVCRSNGGGLQEAVKDRGGISKLRCLHARGDTDVSIEVRLNDHNGDTWDYLLSFNEWKDKEKGSLQYGRVLITKEEVLRNGKDLLVSRPNSDDKDVAQKTQTYLEQVSKNKDFRSIVEFFTGTLYLHLVPQLLKYADKIGGKVLVDDPFGQNFLERIAGTNKKARDSRLKKIKDVLSRAIPQFEDLRFDRDKKSGRPYLEAKYKHHRPAAGWQREEHLSDGTLRLIGLLWTMLEMDDTLLLLEEPELSLHDAIVSQIPLMFERLEKSTRARRQILISTHSQVLLDNKGIDARGVLRLEPSTEGTKIIPPSESELDPIRAGFSVAEVILPKTFPEQLRMF